MPDAGPFGFGFLSNRTSEGYSIPYTFWFEGAPQIAPWVYQMFYDFENVTPDYSIWEIPEACNTATVCPGWS